MVSRKEHTQFQSLQGKGGRAGDTQAECQRRDKRGYSLYTSPGQRTCKRTSASDEVEVEGWSPSLLKRQRQCSAITKDRTRLDTPREFQWGGSGAQDTTGRSVDAKAAALEVMLQLEAGCSTNVPLQKATEQQLDEKLDLKVGSMAIQQGPCVALN